MGIFSKKKKSVLELVDFDLNSIRPEDFELIGEETNSVGTTFKRYEGHLSKNVNGLFDRIEIYDYPDKTKNVFFKSDLNQTDIGKLKTFVNDLVSIYGNDFTDSGKLDKNEAQNISVNQFWTGRTWDNVNPTVAIDVIEDQVVKLTISGIK